MDLEDNDLLWEYLLSLKAIAERTKAEQRDKARGKPAIVVNDFAPDGGEVSEAPPMSPLAQSSGTPAAPPV
eukprot:6829093-Pyramimonas_sp.AAC.1